jgi:formate dehydrogenase major subunit
VKGLVRGDAANDLIGFVADPNVSIQESKAFTANIQPGRTSKERRHVTSGPLPGAKGGGDKHRDLPQARHKPETKHGFKAQETKEGNV